jgi:hypothetical protein
MSRKSTACAGAGAISDDPVPASPATPALPDAKEVAATTSDVDAAAATDDTDTSDVVAAGSDPTAASGSEEEEDAEEEPPLTPAARETLFRERTAAVQQRIAELTRREQEIVRERAALDVEAQAADQQVATAATELAEMPARISAARAQLVAIQGASPRAEASAKAHLEAERQRKQQLQAALAEGTRAAEAVHARVAETQERLTQEAAEIVAERAELAALVAHLHGIITQAHEETGLAILAGWRADYDALSARITEAEAALAAAQAELERYRAHIILPGLDNWPELRAAARTLLPAEESHVVQALEATIAHYQAWERLTPHLEALAVRGRPLYSLLALEVPSVAASIGNRSGVLFAARRQAAEAVLAEVRADEEHQREQQ